MPKRRKGPALLLPPLEILLRNAQPTWREITGEADPHKRRAAELARVSARAELMRMYRKAKKMGAVTTLPHDVRVFCQDLEKYDPAGAALAAAARTGAPDQSHQRLRIAVRVVEENKARGSKRGDVEAAIRAVAKEFGMGYDRVRKIYYDPRPGWRRAIAVSLKM